MARAAAARHQSPEVAYRTWGGQGSAFVPALRQHPSPWQDAEQLVRPLERLGPPKGSGNSGRPRW